MTWAELVSIGLVKRVLESAKGPAKTHEDSELTQRLQRVIAALDSGCRNELLRRKQPMPRPEGLVLRILPACTATDLRSTLGTALTTCQLILPHLPEWVLREVRYVEEYCRESLRVAGDDEK